MKKCVRFTNVHVERGEKQQTKQMVEAAGQLTHYFHNGLDYSFIWTDGLIPEESIYERQGLLSS